MGRFVAELERHILPGINEFRDLSSHSLPLTSGFPLSLLPFRLVHSPNFPLVLVGLGICHRYGPTGCPIQLRCFELGWRYWIGVIGTYRRFAPVEIVPWVGIALWLSLLISLRLAGRGTGYLDSFIRSIAIRFTVGG